MIQLAALCLAAVAGVLVLEGYRALRRRWLLKRLPLVHRGTVTPIESPEDGERYFHAILESDGKERVLYQGRNAMQAKLAYYRGDLPGTITFWDGTVCRGKRVVP